MSPPPVVVDGVPIVVTGRPAVSGMVSDVLFGRLPDGREVAIKQARDESTAGELGREAALLALLDGRCHAPRPVCSNATILVIERLPGAVVLTDGSRQMFDEYARTLCAIHSLDVTPDAPTPSAVAVSGWSSWVDPGVAPPDWAGDRALWAEAIDISRGPAPIGPTVFCHRDFHPGNLLVEDFRITGVVDWGAAVIADAAVDLSHLVHNLVCLHGMPAAPAMVDAYRTAAVRRGLSTTDPTAPYWWVHEILSWLPDPAEILPPWRKERPDLTPGIVRTRSEQLLRWCLRRGSHRPPAPGTDSTDPPAPTQEATTGSAAPGTLHE